LAHPPLALNVMGGRSMHAGSAVEDT